jgi:hypothetical protein
MEPTDLTIEILEGIREDTHALRDGLQQTNEELRRTREEVRQTNLRVGAVREVRDMLRDDLRLRDRVEDHEKRIAAMEGDTR